MNELILFVGVSVTNLFVLTNSPGKQSKWKEKNLLFLFIGQINIFLSF